MHRRKGDRGEAGGCVYVQSPIKWLEGADVVIVDPPRKGLDPSVLAALRLASVRGQGKGKPPSAAARLK